MTRSKPGPEFVSGAVRLDELGLTVSDAEQAGYAIHVHWSGEFAISDRDAYAFCQRRRMVAEQGMGQWSDTLAAQREWFDEKNRVYTEAYRLAERGRGTPKAFQEGVEAGAAAVRRWAKHNRPEDVGLPAGLVDDTSTTVTGHDDDYDPDHINWAPMVGANDAS